MEIYGFAGKIGSGKNFISEKIFLPMLNEKKTIILAFADHFKIESIVKDKLDYDKVFGEKDEITRKALQRRGTELGRKKFGKDIWVNIVKNWIKLYESRGYERFIITDCRFINEIRAIKELGGTVFKIVAPNRNLTRLKREAELNNSTVEELSSHVSEKEIELPAFGRWVDYVIKNDYNDDAISQISEIVEKNILPKLTSDLTIFVDLDDTICECDKYYHIQMNKSKELLRTVIDSNNIDRLMKIYEQELVKNNNDTYYLTHFTKEKFAESLCKSFDELDKHYIFQNNLFRETREKIFNIGMEVFNYTYEQKGNSIETIKELQKLGNVVIYTVGDRMIQVKKILRLGLIDIPYEIFDHKDETLFRNLKIKYPSNRYCMIGDSEYRDIIPAIKTNFDDIFYITNRKDGKLDRAIHIEKIEDVLEYLKPL